MPRTKDDEDDDDEGPLETEKKRRRASSKGSSSTRRATSSSTRSTRRRPVSGEDLVGSLNGMIAELIKENRQLKRKVERLQKAEAARDLFLVHRKERPVLLVAVLPLGAARQRISKGPPDCGLNAARSAVVGAAGLHANDWKAEKHMPTPGRMTRRGGAGRPVAKARYHEV